MGVGNSIAERPVGDETGPVEPDPDRPEHGQERAVRDGLSMGNGVDRGPDGAIYASNDFGSNIDRIRERRDRARLGEASSRATASRSTRPAGGCTSTQTFQPAAIQRVEIADPTNVTPFAVAPAEDSAAGFDGMDRDREGQPVRRGQRRRLGMEGHAARARCACCCAACRGSRTGPAPSRSACTASAFRPENLYVVAFNGDVTEIEGVARWATSRRLRSSGSGRPACDGRRGAHPLQGVRIGERPAGRGRHGAAGGPRGADQPAREREAHSKVQARGQTTGARDESRLPADQQVDSRGYPLTGGTASPTRAAPYIPRPWLASSLSRC